MMHIDGATYDALTWQRVSWDDLAAFFWVADDRRRGLVRETSKRKREVAALRRGPRGKAGPKIGSVAGSRNPSARLTEEQVAEIRRALDTAKAGVRGALVRELREQAARFRVSEATVKAIRAGRLWKEAA